jgi:hypothetical protein
MAVRPGFIPIGETGEFLDSVQVNTPAGDDLHRETVVFADAEDPAGLAKVTNAPPAANAYGAVVRVAGAVDVVTETTKVVIPADQSLDLDFVGGAYQSGAAQLTAEVVYVGNLPTSYPLSAGAATSAKQLPDNHQVQVSNFPEVQAVDITENVTIARHVTVAAAEETIVVTPASGKAIRLWWYSVTASANNTSMVVVGLRFGAGGTDFFRTSLSMHGQGMAHSFRAGHSYYQGAVNQALIVNLDSAQTIFVNIDYQEVTP